MGAFQDDKLFIDKMASVQMLPSAPVVLVAVGDKTGTERNIITVGMFNLFSQKPPQIGIAVLTSRQSYKLLEECADFSVNIPGKDMIDQVILCGTRSGKDTDKFKETGLTAVPGKRIKSPKIEECLINYEVKKTQTFEVGDHTWYIGEVVHTDATKDYDRSQALLFWDGEFSTSGKVLRKL
jgi:flavin reductase (DIM6/NTAB) family NADH-FMN oxidoreductase RutF